MGTDCEEQILFLCATTVDLKSHFSCNTELIMHYTLLQKEQACFNSGVPLLSLHFMSIITLVFAIKWHNLHNNH